MSSPDQILLEAASSGDVAGVELAILQGASVDAVNSFGATALICAATKGYIAVIKLLIASNCRLEYLCGPFGSSALHQAVSFEHFQIVELLLDAGAVVDGRTTVDGTTPLMIAAARGNFQIVRLLIERGAMPNLQDDQGWNAWAWAIDKGEGHVAEFLVEAGALPEFPKVDG